MKNLTDIATWSTQVQVPEDNIDLVNGESVEPDSFQLLANRTAYLREFVDAQSPASRTVLIPLFGSFATSTFPISPGALPIAVASSAGGSASVEVLIGRYVPVGATITKVRALVNPATSEAIASDRMSLELFKSTISGTTLTHATQGVYNCATSATGIQWIDSGTISKSVGASEVWTAKVAAGLNVGVSDIFQIVEVTFTDPGARNY